MTTTFQTSLSITFNGLTMPLSSRTTLAALLLALGQDCTGMATAVNGDFVARDERNARVLEAGDSVTVFRPIVGG
jgi:sulfur carrier protein